MLGFQFYSLRLGFLLRFLVPARRMARDERGVAAVEFAIVGLPFFVVVFAIMEIAFHAFVVSALDTSVLRASRTLLVGSFQSRNGTIDDFRNEICRGLPFGIGCSSLVVDVRPFKAWSEVGSEKLGAWNVLIEPLYEISLNQSDNKFCPGGPRDIVLVRARFIIPAVANLFLNDAVVYNGKKVRIASSNHLFRVEPYMGSQSTGSAGCA